MPKKNVEADLWEALTIYEQLDIISQGNQGNQGAINWAVYGWPGGQYDSDWFRYCNLTTANSNNANRNIANFTDDIKTGNLPFYSFLMPSLNLSNTDPNGNSMHPDGDVRLGENYIAQVYNALAKSDIWNNTLLIITFDENGGIYDHMPPPKTTPPDGINYPVPVGDPPLPPLFDYSILGPRVPALLISPWLANPNGAQGPYQIDSTQYQNTSIPRFVQDLFEAQKNGNASIGRYSLTKRDQNANSVANSSFWRNNASTSCPTNIEIYTGTDIEGNHIPPWGTCLSSEKNCPPVSIMNKKPTETTMHFVKGYLNFYPGHPDSGKPLTREFKTNSELVAYMQERKEAARNLTLPASEMTCRHSSGQ